MQQQITRGDYLKDLITIYVENNLQTELSDLYSKFVFQCGEIQKILTPAPVIKISFSEQESQLLKTNNTCYLAGITTEGHKETFNGSLTFNTRGEVVYYEPTVTTTAATVTTSASQGITGIFANCTQPAIKAYFSINYVPTKLSELTNDTDFVDSFDLTTAVSTHNISTTAHTYIQDLITSSAENLTTSINTEVSTRATADTLLQNNINAEASTRQTEITSAISTAETYTTSSISTHNTSETAHPFILSAINSEASTRETADTNLQNQIDGLSAASDVTDIVGTYAELQSYDTSHLNNNDIIKVLTDSTHDNAPSYYRYNKSTNTFSYIGSESASYTKTQADNTFVKQTTTINNKTLNTNITLSAADVGALSNTTTISDLTSTAQQEALNSGINTTIVGQVSTNASNITSINEVIPSNATSANQLVTTSTLTSSTTVLADKDLSNLSINGEARLHALKGYKDNGELLTDAKGLEDVNYYAHSTFDKSKYTINGSPAITADGLANGFSSSNTVFATVAIADTSSYTFRGRYIYHSNVSTLKAIFSRGSQQFGFYLNTNNSLQFITSSLIVGSGAQTYSSGDVIDYELSISSSAQSLKVYKNGTLVSDQSATASISFNHTSLLIGGNNWYGNAYITNEIEIDLKYFSISENGKPVFSGNKTGMDVLKPDNYTVSGSPTISTDGVASGFSDTNYLMMPSYTCGVKPFTIEVKFNSSQVQGHNNRIIQSTANNSTAGPILNLLTTQKLGYYFSSAVALEPNYIIQNNKDYYVRVTYNSGTTTMYISEDGVNYTSIGTASGTITTDVTATMSIGKSLTVTDRYFQGSIDLNALKIYVDGALIYQGCMKIPYNESKTGSKVVNAVYRDRVNDMTQQFGYAPYYTLDEGNKNFTLPFGELYGLIQKISNRPDYTNTITTSDVSGSGNAYTFAYKSLAIIKPSTPASTYTISVKPVWGTSYSTINAYGYMSLIMNNGDSVYTSASATIDIFKFL